MIIAQHISDMHAQFNPYSHPVKTYYTYLILINYPNTSLKIIFLSLPIHMSDIKTSSKIPIFKLLLDKNIVGFALTRKTYVEFHMLSLIHLWLYTHLWISHQT